MVIIDSWRVSSLPSETIWSSGTHPSDSVSGSLLPHLESPHILPRFFCIWYTLVTHRFLYSSQISSLSSTYSPHRSAWVGIQKAAQTEQAQRKTSLFLQTCPPSYTPSCGQWYLTSNKLFQKKLGHHPCILSPFDFCLLEFSEHQFVPYCHCSRPRFRSPNARTLILQLPFNAQPASVLSLWSVWIHLLINLNHSTALIRSPNPSVLLSTYINSPSKTLVLFCSQLWYYLSPN